MKKHLLFLGGIATVSIFSFDGWVAATSAVQGPPGTLTVTAEGAPAADIDVFALIDGETRPLGTTGAGGRLGFDPALFDGKVRVQVAVHECPDRRDLFFVRGATDEPCREVEEASEKEGCQCADLGAVWWGRDLRVDVVTLTMVGGESDPFF